MADLNSEKTAADRIDKKYKAAKAIVKWLADFTADEKVQVIQHVAVELKLPVAVSGVQTSEGA